jgi:polyhydroxyalkanoate synthesis regulator phasin
MARRETESIISKLRHMSEEGLGSVVNELMSNEKLRKRLGRAGERLMANKHVFDRNVETVLDFVNIPSKRDVRELKSRLDTLSSQFVNLSMKVDRMLAATGGGAESGAERPAPVHRLAPRRPVRRSKSD